MHIVHRAVKIAGHTWATNLISHLFTERFIDRWNSLSQEAVNAPGVIPSRINLRSVAKMDQPIDFFMDRRSSKSYGYATRTDPSSLSSILLARSSRTQRVSGEYSLEERRLILTC